ncbi:smg-9, nonsense mediated mRNA decay factor [Borealophlyctis nickersoniae]|nr:smg-9, nonsense mediated mRNA decay factor [Borealophlyctis nickersoniae]
MSLAVGGNDGSLPATAESPRRSQHTAILRQDDLEGGTGRGKKWSGSGAGGAGGGPNVSLHRRGRSGVAPTDVLMAGLESPGSQEQSLKQKQLPTNPERRKGEGELYVKRKRKPRGNRAAQSEISRMEGENEIRVEDAERGSARRRGRRRENVTNGSSRGRGRDLSPTTAKGDRSAFFLQNPVILERRPQVQQRPTQTVPAIQSSARKVDSDIRPPPKLLTHSRSGSAVAEDAHDLNRSMPTKVVQTTKVSIPRSILASSQSSTSRATTIKMMDESLRINHEVPSKYLSDLPGCFIVGAIGRQNAGKTSILSSFCPAPPTSAPTSTSGIDMYITPERIVLLDAQPILTRPAPGAKGRGNASGPIPDAYARKPELWAEIQAAQITMFMLSVCHVILVVSDRTVDEELWSFVRKVEGVRYRSTEAGVGESGRRRSNGVQPAGDAGSGEEEHYPTVVFVANKLAPESMSPHAFRAAASAYAAAFKGSKLRTAGSVTMSTFFPQYTISQTPTAGNEQDQPSPSTGRADPNLFLLPNFPPTTSPTPPSSLETLIKQTRGCPTHPTTLLRTLRNQIFGVPRFVSATAPGSLQAQKRWYSVAERDWFRSASRIWDGIRKADVGGDWCRAGGKEGGGRSGRRRGERSKGDKAR